MYPRLIIDTKKYRHNVITLKTLLNQFELSIMAVTKVFCADSRLIQVLNDSRVDYIADSRIDNLKIIDTTKPKVLLRLVSLSEVEDVVKYANISLNSELKVIEALNEKARDYNTVHKIILMIDIGDLREGVYYKENVLEICAVIETLSHIDLIGLGTNLTCYGGIIPTEETLNKFVAIVDSVEKHLNKKLQLITGGNSSHLHLLYEGKKIAKINNLRLGESLILGRETAYGEPLTSLHQDVIVLEAEVIELKYKPSIPEGAIGMNAFGNRPLFNDVGRMLRAIVAIGRQDVNYLELIPEDDSIQLVGSSSDHIILDLTNTKTEYQVGDIIRFKLTYGSVLSLMTSRYVRRYYV